MLSLLKIEDLFPRVVLRLTIAANTRYLLSHLEH